MSRPSGWTPMLRAEKGGKGKGSVFLWPRADVLCQQPLVGGLDWLFGDLALMRL